MNRIKLLGLAIVAMFALTAVSSAAAEVLPNLLPTGTAGSPVTFTGSSSTSTFGNGIETLTSKKSKATGSATSAKLGTFVQLFEETTDPLGRKCTGLKTGETVGDVEVTGAFHIRYYEEGGSKKVAVLFLINPVHLSCGTTLIKVEGCVAGDLSPLNTLSTLLTATLAKNGNLTDNLIIKVFKENAETGGTGNEENCELLASQNEGTIKLSVEVATIDLTNFKQNNLAVTALVMA